MTLTAAIYARISQDRDGKALGVKRQKADCTALAERNGWQVADTYIDNDVSAFSGKRRPEYERLMGDVKAGVVDVVVAWHPDRLHRSPRELEDFIDVIEASGATVATVTSGDYDLSTPEGRLMARIVGSVARKESEDKSRRIRRKHLELAQDGKVGGGGRRPFGYEADRMTVNSAEAKEIKAAARRVMAGESIRSVAQDWRAREIRTVTGAEWSPTTIKRLLCSGRISGQREHRGKIVGAAVWPAIITPDDTARLRAILSDKSRNKAAGTTVREYLLTGFVRCGNCGTKLTSRPVRRKGIRYRRYACPADRGGCGRVGIGAEPLEDLVVEAVMQRLDTPALADAIHRRDDDVDDLADVEQAEADLEQLSRDFYVDKVIGRAEFLAARVPLEERLAAARDRVASRQPADTLDGIKPGALRKAWPGLSIDRRRAILATIIDEINVARTTKANNKFDPDRVSLTYKV